MLDPRIAMETAGLIETFPPRGSAARQPVLLQSLEAQLLDELAGAAVRLTRHRSRDPQMSANLVLQAHGKVRMHASPNPVVCVPL